MFNIGLLDYLFICLLVYYYSDMSKLYYDKLVVMTKIEVIIKKSSSTPEEKEELWRVVDEMIHHRILNCILENLSEEHHHDFMCLFHEKPHDESILDFVNQRIDSDIKKTIKKEAKLLEKEVLALIKNS